jgi:two-component system, cell cycle sensor histidine kinase and response regulator CckA
MPDFITPSSVDKGIWYFLAARLWASGVLLTAALVPPASTAWLLGRWPLLGLNLLVSAAVFVAVSYFPSHLPTMFVPGEGLTPLKISLEYLVVVLSLLAAAIYLRAFRQSGNRFFELLAAALIVTAFSELFFTLYAAAYDIYNLLGHVYKVVAYYLIFSALFVYGVQRPYRELQGLYDQI